jgi:hypothetical protein
VTDIERKLIDREPEADEASAFARCSVRHKFRISGGNGRPIVARHISSRLRRAAASLAAVNALFFSGDFGEDRPQNKKISAPPRQ